MYPRAKIYAFEPFPENYSLLKINSVLNSDKIIPIQKGLGSKDGYFTYYFPDSSNFDAGTFKNIGCDRRKKFKLPVTTIKKFIQEEKIKKIDILKVDTEGMEFDIITNIPIAILKKIKLIVGECHGIKDLELLLYLSNFFSLGFSKKYESRLFQFVAVNKEILKRKK
jgi:FkbM family methyltransferase